MQGSLHAAGLRSLLRSLWYACNSIGGLQRSLLSGPVLSYAFCLKTRRLRCVLHIVHNSENGAHCVNRKRVHLKLYIKQERQCCLTTFSNTETRVENTTRSIFDEHRIGDRLSKNALVWTKWQIPFELMITNKCSIRQIQ